MKIGLILSNLILSSSLLLSSQEIPTTKEITKLYVATFNRAPDSSGLEYWRDSSNLPLLGIASSFFDQNETQKLYPPDTSNREFIKSIYQNLFNRTPDSVGWDYWEGDLDSGVYSKNLFIQTVISGAVGDDATILENKTTVGLSFINAHIDDVARAKEVLNGVDSTKQSVDLALATIESSWYRPPVDTTWQWQLSGTINSSYGVGLYDIDLFTTSTEEIKALQESGKRVICYFSAGSSEDWRDDFSKFPASTLGNGLDGWEGERWLDIRSQSIKDIMLARLDVAKAKGCDGVEPDNVDGYTNDNGFNLTANEQLEYNKFIAEESHKRGLSVALKNDPDQVALLEPFFDFSVSEECHLYNECDKYLPFIKAGKPIFSAEYDKKYRDDRVQRDKICSDAKEMKIHTLILPLGLDDEFRDSCD